jgi:hypothetical protein
MGVIDIKFPGLLACFVLLVSCGSHNPPGKFSLTSSSTPANYTPRIGVAVITGSRACVAIQNANVTIGGPITLVSPLTPQTFGQAEISSGSSTPCPISKDVDPTVSNYDLHLQQGSTLPKMTPLIAVVGASAPFSVGTNNNVVADLDQNNRTESFRACSAGDGIHLTVWSGNALEGTLLWHGSYYEVGDTGAGPACTAKEMPAATPVS